MKFKPGDIIKLKCAANTHVEKSRYLVIGPGKYPGYIKTFCIRAFWPERQGKAFTFNADVMERHEVV